MHRRHRRSKARSVAREEANAFAWPDSSAQLMVDSLVAKDTDAQPMPCSAKNNAGSVHAALQELTPIDREILMMHYLEELSFPEIAAILDIGEGAAKMRHLRALRRIRCPHGRRRLRGEPMNEFTRIDGRRRLDEPKMPHSPSGPPRSPSGSGAVKPSTSTTATVKNCATSCPPSA